MTEKYKILIIDDEEVVLDSCTEILAGSNHHIATATDGILGMTLVKQVKPDMVFVDLKMPGISGLEVIEKIRAFDPTIVTVVITGYATISSAVEAMKQGAYDFLPKPFTPDEFRLITRRGLEKRKLVMETLALRREKEMLRENFAAIVSHELKSPLSAVQQNLFSLIAELSSQLTDDQQRRFERMKSRLAELLALINTWLRAISVDLETIKEQFKPLAVTMVIARAVETVQPHALRKNVELVVSVAEPLSLIYGDAGTLTEAVVNICTNAVKYSQPGSRVLIKAEEKAEDVSISVADSGVGIADDELPFIFDDFFRGKSGQLAEGGHGLGLAISRRIIEIHSGTISVESKPGQGSTFTVRLPKYEGDPARPNSYKS